MQALTSNCYKNTISIYIHFPWCIKKCPYCDFNSYINNNKISEQLYIKKILADFDNNLELLLKSNKKKIISIFFGGGTPSLLSGQAVSQILNHINKKFTFTSDLEITLEVNPGTIEQDSMQNYRASGITRISLGAQSFQDDKLKLLGRIHKSRDIKFTINNIIKHNFSNFNIDLMYGLPNQTIDDAIYDLQEALSFSPPHISWYQLTIEPNTSFYKTPPKLPNDEIIWNTMQKGLKILKKNNYINYETSAFAKPNYYCKHNLNYWQYGDYLGLGPGAHSKITTYINNDNFKILRLVKPKSPKSYFYSEAYEQRILTKQEIIFEFMLNNLRLKEGFLKEDFMHRTSFNLDCILDTLNFAAAKNLLKITSNRIKPTPLGRRFLNDLQELFI
jgi:oxygen-independent coproporphyrinogen-3 oxidase